MSTTRYFTIADSIPTRTKKFRVVQGGYKPIISKRMDIRETISGGLDVAQGSVYHIHQYVVRLRETETETDFGTKADMEWFYLLNNPQPTSGSPGDLLTVTDHYGVTRTGYLVGNHVPEPVTTVLEGEDAWFLVPVEFRFVPE